MTASLSLFFCSWFLEAKYTSSNTWKFKPSRKTGSVGSWRTQSTGDLIAKPQRDSFQISGKKKNLVHGYLINIVYNNNQQPSSETTNFTSTAGNGNRNRFPPQDKSMDDHQLKYYNDYKPNELNMFSHFSNSKIPQEGSSGGGE